MIYLANRRDNERTKAQSKVQVFSNLKDVKLEVNGKSYTAKQGVNDKHWVVEQVDLKQGQNTIVAVGKDGSKELRDEMVWNLK